MNLPQPSFFVVFPGRGSQGPGLREHRSWAPWLRRPRRFRPRGSSFTDAADFKPWARSPPPSPALGEMCRFSFPRRSLGNPSAASSPEGFSSSPSGLVTCSCIPRTAPKLCCCVARRLGRAGKRTVSSPSLRLPSKQDFTPALRRCAASLESARMCGLRLGDALRLCLTARQASSKLGGSPWLILLCEPTSNCSCIGFGP